MFTDRKEFVPAPAYDEKVARMSWCEFNSAYKRKLRRTWNSPTRRSKSRQRNLPSSRGIYEPRSIYRPTGSRTRAIIDVLNLPTWPAWSRARGLSESDLKSLASTGLPLCFPEEKLHTGVFFFYFFIFLINWSETCCKKGEVWSSEIRWNSRI